MVWRWPFRSPRRGANSFSHEGPSCASGTGLEASCLWGGKPPEGSREGITKPCRVNRGALAPWWSEFAGASNVEPTYRSQVTTEAINATVSVDGCVRLDSVEPGEQHGERVGSEPRTLP